MTRRWAEESISAMETLEKAGGSINDTEVRLDIYNDTDVRLDIYSA